MIKNQFFFNSNYLKSLSDNFSEEFKKAKPFKHVVIDGALYHCFMFRDNTQQAAVVRQRFEDGVDRMRTLLINRFTDVRDTRVSRLINVPHGNG